MTYPPPEQPPAYQPPVMPGPSFQQPPPPWAPQPPKKKNRALPWILGIVGGIVGLCMILGVIGAIAGGDSTKTNGSGKPLTTATTAAEDAATEAAPAATTPKSSQKPKAADFKLTAKVTKKDCFGSAGCNVEFRVACTYSGPPLDDSTTWLVTYEINGVDDAPEVGSLELTGDTFSSEEESVGTPSSKSKITLKVTDVEEQ